MGIACLPCHRALACLAMGDAEVQDGTETGVSTRKRRLALHMTAEGRKRNDVTSRNVERPADAWDRGGSLCPAA